MEKSIIPPKNRVSSFKTRRVQKNLFLTVMLAIPVIHWFVFWLYCNISSFVLPFQNAAGDFVGWKNFLWYWKNLTSDKPAVDMFGAIINTFKFFFFGLLVEKPLSLIFCYFLYKKIKGHKAFRVILYLPSILSTLIMVTVFKNFIRSDGPLDQIVQMCGGDPLPKFLYDSRYALNTMLVYSLWNGFGLGIILYTGAMERIPKDIIEYGLLDGLTPLKEIWHITIPLIWPTLSMQIFLSFADIFTSGGPVLLFTKGEYDTMTVAYSIWEQLYFYKMVNRAATMGLIYTLAGIPLVVLSRWLLSKMKSTEEY